MDNKGIIVNKYGAVDVEEITRLIRRVDQLQTIIEKMAGVENYPKELRHVAAFKYHTLIMYDLPEDFKKMKELTKCNEYEYKTTPETKKLVKKSRKQVKDE